MFLCSFRLQSMKERSREISIHMDMLKAQSKAAEEEKQTIRWVLFCKNKPFSASYFYLFYYSFIDLNYVIFSFVCLFSNLSITVYIIF